MKMHKNCSVNRNTIALPFVHCLITIIHSTKIPIATRRLLDELAIFFIILVFFSSLPNNNGVRLCGECRYTHMELSSGTIVGNSNRFEREFGQKPARIRNTNSDKFGPDFGFIRTRIRINSGTSLDKVKQDFGQIRAKIRIISNTNSDKVEHDFG